MRIKNVHYYYYHYDMPPERTEKVRLGIYRSHIQPSDIFMKSFRCLSCGPRGA